MKVKLFRTNKAKWTAVAVAGLLLTGSVVGLSARVSAQEKTKVLGVSAFSVGLLDDETGKLLTGDNKDNSGLSTDLYYKFDENFSVELEKDATTLSKGVELYEESVALAKQMYEELNNVKGKITVIKQELDKYREEGLDK